MPSSVAISESIVVTVNETHLEHLNVRYAQVQVCRVAEYETPTIQVASGMVFVCGHCAP